MPKRQDYITWDEYFMGVAKLAALRSKDPGTQVGACIVNEANKIISTGYNGFPLGCDDDEFPWDREGESGRLPDLRRPLPLQRMCEGYHSKWNSGDHLHQRQV